MKIKITFVIFFLFFISGISFSQNSDTTLNSKKILDHSVYDFWKKIERPSVSNDGSVFVYELNPQKGDGNLIIYDFKKNIIDTINRGYESIISANNDFVSFKIKPQDDSTRKAKQNKKKKEDMPKDSLGIYYLKNNTVAKFPLLKSFSVSLENTSVVAFTNEIRPVIKDTLSKNTSETYNFNILNTSNDIKRNTTNVTEFKISKSGNAVSYIVLKKGKTDSSSVCVYDVSRDTIAVIFYKAGILKNITIDNKGEQVAFLYSGDTAKIKRFSLYNCNIRQNRISLVADTSAYGIPNNWEIPENASINFSDDGKKLFFATAPKIYEEPKDTILEEDKFKVDVWNYQDPKLQTEQLFNLENDKKKTYLAVYNIESANIIQLADTSIEEIITTGKSNSMFALGLSYKPYYNISSWEDADFKDVYLINTNTGSKQLIIPKLRYQPDLSPFGKYVIWFDVQDSSWYSYSTADGNIISVTKQIPVSFVDELNDKPAPPDPYGFAVWSENDETIFIYDRYDIWKISPDNSSQPVNLTNGRENRIISRFIKLDYENNFVKKENNILIRRIDEKTYSESFCSIDLLSNTSTGDLISAPAHFIGPYKSKKSDKIYWYKSTYTEYNDLWFSTLEFKNIRKLSDANPQQKDYLWGTVELVDWKNSEGEDMRGLLYKPENFDSTQKYPMIIYFYEKYTDKIHTHYIPNPSRSVINYPMYNSNGYLVFLPDLTYKIGYPGESALEGVVSGAKYLISKGFVDENNIGLQGQSWGGYQVAYIVTQTDMFKAAMAGAPVSNMTSAYGGIRWESGKNRIFLYEQGQSRIGGTLWEKTDLYIKNSPVFFADKVNTPLLIMANDGDGAVPWQEGILYFVSLRRLGKEAWLLNYNTDEHNLTKWPNRKDLSIRMKQYFDHYLKGEPMPVWMKEGLPALYKGKKTGYELLK
jgi:dipeptidyl aminopeptidase/acylaminoacyl peptidase